MKRDAETAYFATGTPDSKSYVVRCSNVTAYADLPPGYYDCWLPAGAQGEHLRFCYLPMPNSGAPPTIAAGSFPAPTPATSAQASGVPAAAAGAWMAPATAGQIRLYVPAGYRVAVLYSAATTVDLYCSRVSN